MPGWILGIDLLAAADSVRGISVPLLGVGVMVGAAVGAGVIAWREARR